MTSDVVLTAALRNNLLSLQSTQRSIDTTQFRLATGRKVNSALDNPQNFFAAQSLNNRAGDLTRLLDGIGQSIQTIQTADKGVTGLTKLVEQAESIVNSARDELLASEGEARVTGSTDLSNVSDLTSLANITAGAQFDINVVGSDGILVSETITINAGDTAESLAAQITNAFADNQNGEIEARVTDDGFLDIYSTDGQTFRVVDNSAVQATTLNGFADLGFTTQFANELDGAGNTLAAATIVAGKELSSVSIYEAAGDLAEAGDLLTGTYDNADGTQILGGLAAGDSISISVNGTNTITFGPLAGTETFQDLVDAVNQDANVNELISAEFDGQTGQLKIKSISGDTDFVEISVTGAAATDFNLGFGDDTGALDPLATTGAGNQQDRVYAFSTGSAKLESLAADYNEVRTQIDRLVVDSNYRGTNLLQGDDLVTFFNELRSSSLTTQGVDFSADGLGITETTFANSSIVDSAADEIRGALEAVRAFGNTLSNDLAIIQTREDFTNEVINTLTEGADKLTVADQNEEGAKLLALQTRQQLGVTSLALASQSQQSILRLF
ncbi:MAG: flagellin [Rhodospirillales bacterium]|nr:flagellin [Rhodospirillales bacterium]